MASSHAPSSRPSDGSEIIQGARWVMPGARGHMEHLTIHETQLQHCSKSPGAQWSRASRHCSTVKQKREPARREPSEGSSGNFRVKRAVMRPRDHA
eukprot:scaffold23779_cov112-Isochrysis_galbana.AAC.3